MIFWLLKTIISLLFVLSINAESDYDKLPYCSDNAVPGVVLVSTIDGKFSAVDFEGMLQWQIDTDPGPLLISNIHNLELTNNGRWIRIIPSLTGSLYRFDGIAIESIPVSAESLLRSSFKYSDDQVIAGGLEVTTYGVGFRSGKIFYTCSSLKCTNNSNSDNKVDDILLVERSTQTVRAVESQTGHERWNFSVGYLNIKLPQKSCTERLVNLDWNITAIIPDGLLLASKEQDNAKTTWQYHFSSPIVRVWKWNGHTITEVDLFQLKSDPSDMQLAPAMYIGMHKKQLYIYESYALQSKEYTGTAISETGSLNKIPWKPVSASGFLTEDDSTAISILYSSEYVNGHGYYLYSDNDMKKKTGELCQNNETVTLSVDSQKLNMTTVRPLLLLWWKEMLVTVLTVVILFSLMFKSFSRHQQEDEIFSKQPSKELSETVVEPFNVSNSRFLNDFHTLRCLGKGGFGVVFEVKQKIDECHYAIKRIVLPNEENKKEAVMREVKALAKLEHHNIVRYFNSWVEKPPYGWQQQYDSEWIKDANEYTVENTDSPHATSNNLSTVFSNIACINQFTVSKELRNNYAINDKTEMSDSFIIFNNSYGEASNGRDSIKIDEKYKKLNTTSYEASQSLGGVNWRKPPRRYHSFCDSTPSPIFLYIQMQLCQKHSLREWLVENKDRSLHYILDIFKQIVSAVEYVHLQGLIHRDLKPSNIFFSLNGQIKVGDFGLVKDEEESRDTSSVQNPLRAHTKEVGTRLYMSPEQLNGQKYNYKVDIYSLGLIFFELLVYFSTDMERIKTLMNLRENIFPNYFIEQHTAEHNLLTKMLCHSPEERLTTFGIRARPPLNCDTNKCNKAYDFELPKCEKLQDKYI